MPHTELLLCDGSDHPQPGAKEVASTAVTSSVVAAAGKGERGGREGGIGKAVEGVGVRV